MIVGVFITVIGGAIFTFQLLGSFREAKLQNEVADYYQNATEATEQLRRDANLAQSATVNSNQAVFTLRNFDGSSATAAYNVTYTLSDDTCSVRGTNRPCKKLQRTDSRNSGSPVTFRNLLQVQWCLWSNPLSGSCPVGFPLPNLQPDTNRAILISMQYLPFTGSAGTSSTVRLVAELENTTSTTRDPGIQLLKNPRSSP